MSVLNQSGEEQVECPLCMEPLEVDDLNFYPCTCGYQICRFCWHRIRTDENGLCPACRKQYGEDPADFIPLSQEQVAKLKAEKRQRDQQRKAKVSENRKHLASVRVVQRNLVFVVGLPIRLADPEVLKRHEYFGKFGKIHKVVINQSTAYAGSQGPSASAYVTYMKSDDALRAIHSVNNVTIDGRLIKSSLGTTKYCSHFMKNQPCPKPDCMYLHDFGDPEASFTKEQMHLGKHQEYEKKLHDALQAKMNQLIQQQQTPSNGSSGSSSGGVIMETSTTQNNSKGTKVKDGATVAATVTASTNKENWPQLNINNDMVTITTSSTTTTVGKATDNGKKSKLKCCKDGGSVVKKEKKLSDSSSQSSVKSNDSSGGMTSQTSNLFKDCCGVTSSDVLMAVTSSSSSSSSKLGLLDDNSSFFSCNGFRKIPVTTATTGVDGDGHHDDLLNGGDSDEGPRSPILSDNFPDIDTIADWAAAFGLSSNNSTTPDMAEQQANVNEDFTRCYDMSQFFDCLNKDSPTAIQQQQQQQHTGLDHHMSKFFMDFHQKQNGYLGNTNNGLIQQNGGYVVQDQQQQQQQQERLVMMQQMKLEEHLIGLNSTKQNYNNGGGQNGYYGGYQQQQQQSHQQNKRIVSEDELDFDPFQETQKALAELMANEQNHKAPHTSGGGGHTSTPNQHLQHHQMNNRVVHNHLPPPPPGFVQPSATHMNSFGSKILPFLNMSNNSQQISPNSQNWSNFNGIQQQQHQQHNKGLNGCNNDWKDFDSAIVTTRRHYPFSSNGPANMGRDYSSQQQQQHRQHHHPMSNGQLGVPPTSSQLRPQDYNNVFTNFTQQLQQQQQQQPPTMNGYNNTTQAQTSNLWFPSEISSPPGFRSTNQTSKQQEC